MPQLFALRDGRQVSTAELGRATELRVQAELIERGYDVSVPLIDTGYDLLVEGLRVQVKSSNIRVQSSGVGGSGQYVFSSKRGWRADVYVLRGVQDDCWWVVPHGNLVAVAGERSLTLAPFPQPRGIGRPNRSQALDCFRDSWDVFDG